MYSVTLDTCFSENNKSNYWLQIFFAIKVDLAIKWTEFLKHEKKGHCYIGSEELVSIYVCLNSFSKWKQQKQTQGTEEPHQIRVEIQFIRYLRPCIIFAKFKKQLQHKLSLLTLIIVCDQTKHTEIMSVSNDSTLKMNQQWSSSKERKKNTTHYQKCNHEAVIVFPLLKGSYYVPQHHTVLEFYSRPFHTDRQHYTSRQQILEAT